MVDSLIGSAPRFWGRSKPQYWDRSKYRNWEYYRFRNDTNIGYITVYKIQSWKSQNIQILEGYYIDSKQHLEFNLTINADLKLLMSITRVRAATKTQMQQQKILYAETEIFDVVTIQETALFWCCNIAKLLQYDVHQNYDF